MPLQNVLTYVPDNLKAFMDFIQTWQTHVFGSGLIYLFIWGFTLLSTLYRSYHDGLLEGQRKPVHTVGQGSVL